MLRIGLLVSSVSSSKYAHDFAEWAKVQDDLEIAALIVCGDAERTLAARRGGPIALVRRMAWRMILAVERRMLRRYTAFRDHYARFDLSRVVKAEIHLGEGTRPAVPDFSGASDLRSLANAQLDLLVMLHPVALDRSILGASRLGVIALGSADQPAIVPWGFDGFRECCGGLPSTKFAVRRYAAGRDRPATLMRGAVRTEWFFSLNQAALFTKSMVYLKDVLKRMAGGEAAAERGDGDDDDDAASRPPGLGQTVTYGIRSCRREAQRLWTRLARLTPRWSISVARSGWEKLDPARMTKLAPPAGHFWADPFLWSRDGKTCCFVEDYVYTTGRGHIAALELGEDGATERGAALRESFHLSFPFLFEHDGQLFMCPESVEAGQVRLYRCVDFPLGWEPATVLMEIRAADTMIFPHGRRWWMLTSLDRSGVGDYCYELNLFSADNPLSRTWTPHPQNPIRVDSIGGRNAGMTVRDGTIYRFAQRQGFDRYGEGLMVFEVTELSPSRYSERLVREILPDFGRGLIGLHHMTTDGRHTVIDHLSLERVDR